MRKNSGYMGNTNALKYKTEEELTKGIQAYYKDCEKRKVPYTMSGLALSLGIDRTTLVRYGDKDLFATQIKEAKRKVENQLEENALANKTNTTFTIFNLKNNFGWVEEQRIENKVEDDGVLSKLVEALTDVKKD